MGININVRYEKTATTFRGRPDAVYGYLTIEYKVPSKLSRKTDTLPNKGILSGMG